MSPTPPPRFGLGQLLGLMAMVALLAAAWRMLGPWWGVALLLGTALLVAHLVATYLGHALRERATPRSGPRRRPKPRATKSCPLRTRPSTLYIQRGVLIGAAVAAVVGGGLLAARNWERLGPANLLAGLTALLALGGVTGFWIGSLIQVLTAWVRESNQGSVDGNR